MSAIQNQPAQILPPIEVGGEGAFIQEFARRIKEVPTAKGRILTESTCKSYVAALRKLVGTGTTEVYLEERTSNETIPNTELVPKLLLRDLPVDMPTEGRVWRFVKAVGQRHFWHAQERRSNGAAEAAFKKIYELFPATERAGAPWTELFPESAPVVNDDDALLPPASGDAGDSGSVVDDAGGENDTVEDELNEYETHGSGEDDGDAPLVVAPPVQAPRQTFIVAGARARVKALANGTMIVADPGAGKTYMLKHLIDAVVEQIPSIENILIVDMKGDLSQIVYAAPGRGEVDSYDKVYFEVMTFGSAIATWATLSGFDSRVDLLERIDVSSANPLFYRDSSIFASTARALAQDLLMDTIVKTKDGKERLGGGIEVPSARGRVNPYGSLAAKDEELVAERLSTAVVQVLFKCRKAGVALPRSYGELLEEISVANVPRCRDGSAADAIDANSLDQADLDVLATELSIRSADLSWAPLYRPESSGDAYGPASAVVPLSGERLLAKPPPGFNKRVTIVNCALFGDSGIDDFKRRTIASTVITRLERQVTLQSEGSQETPKSMLIVDEASFVMPNSRAKATGPDVSAMVSVTRLIKKHRDKGMSVVLATQRPKDLHTEIRSIVTGMRFVGTFLGDSAEKKMVMESIIKDEAPRAQSKQMLSHLGHHQFVMVNDGSVSTVRARPLKRLHESSLKWEQTDRFTLDDLMSTDERTREEADKSHPLAAFTRNVRMRLA